MRGKGEFGDLERDGVGHWGPAYKMGRGSFEQACGTGLQVVRGQLSLARVGVREGKLCIVRRLGSRSLLRVTLLLLTCSRLKRKRREDAFGSPAVTHFQSGPKNDVIPDVKEAPGLGAESIPP